MSDWLRWRDVRPALLKSAGVVGLAGIVVALVSTGFVTMDSSAPVREPTKVQPAFKLQQASADAPAQKPAATKMAEPGVTVVQSTPIMRINASAPLFTASLTPELPTQPKPTAQAIAAATQAAPAEAESDGALWSDDALNCPRNWVDVGESGGAATSDGCSAEIGPVALAEAQPRADVAAEDSESADPALMDLVPRVPAPRPDPPPKAQVKTTRWASLGPPPNCGSKHAKWRYVDKRRSQRQWYCR